MSFSITQDYIKKGRARSGAKLHYVRFIVSHDTGNPGATAKQNRDYFNQQQPSASAHTFIDDTSILEIIPLKEKAWHVRYNITEDKRLFGAKANDAAIGIELAWGGAIDFAEAYTRYVWYHAFLSHRFHLDPLKHIVPHCQLDPGHRTDPVNAFKHYTKTWGGFIHDVSNSYQNDFFIQKDPLQKTELPTVVLKKGNKHPEVKHLQLALNAFLDVGLAVDGLFGSKTEQALREFQKTHPPLVVDGIYGPKTRAMMRKLLSNSTFLLR